MTGVLIRRNFRHRHTKKQQQQNTVKWKRHREKVMRRWRQRRELGCHKPRTIWGHERLGEAGKNSSSGAAVPALLAAGTGFTEGNFSTYWDCREWFSDDSSTSHSLCTLFHCYCISSTSDHQALDPEGWGPLMEPSESSCLLNFRLLASTIWHNTFMFF